MMMRFKEMYRKYKIFEDEIDRISINFNTQIYLMSAWNPISTSVKVCFP